MRTVVIAGGGIGAIRCAGELRRLGFEGGITVLERQDRPPYDLPPLTKAVLREEFDPDGHALRPLEWFRDEGIDLVLGVGATALKLVPGEVMTDGATYPFTELVIATGSEPRLPPWARGRPGVHVVRSLDQALELRAAMAAARRMVVVGAGLIGSEIASAAHAAGIEVEVIEASVRPLARFGPAVGEMCLALHERAGVRVRCGVGVAAVEVSGTGVERVLLEDGSSVPCDAVVVAVGAAPRTDWLADSGLEIDDGVICDENLHARGTDHVYAIGDVARWLHPLYGESVRFEQWTNAVQQGRHVAGQIVGRTPVPYRELNYFWSEQYGAQLQFVGRGTADVVADPIEQLVRFHVGEDVVGAFGVDAAAAVMRLRRLIVETDPVQGRA
ncbi:MAG: FAD-dependent oxidoreductase [Actinobacteria bacterium]|nr:FAD-dependent oxidoreductase [Actinomycetota bacterium]